MKWGKLKKDLDKMGLDAGRRKQCFEEYTNIQDVNKRAGNDGKERKAKRGINASTSTVFGEWVTYPCGNSDTYPEKIFPDLGLTKLPAWDKEGRERYEIFCGGFLFYHDVIFKKYQIKDLYLKYYGEKGKKRVFEHKIYFEWDVDGNDLATKVTIYITETPPELNPDPPDPPGGPPPY